MESSIKTKNRAVFGRVLIKREIRKKTLGGIIIPDDTAKRNATCEGIIVDLGQTAGWAETYDTSGNVIKIREFKVGDKVVFGRHSGAWLDATYGAKGELNDDGTLFICQDADILTVIEEAA